MDAIFLRDLRVQTIVGVWDWERQMPQTVSIDLEVGADIVKAAASDKLDDTVNYKAVAKGVTELVVEGQFRLVETMAQRIADYILSDHSATWVRVTVNKPGALRATRDVGVRIERHA